MQSVVLTAALCISSSLPYFIKSLEQILDKHIQPCNCFTKRKEIQHLRRIMIYMKKNKLALYITLLCLIVTLCGCTLPQSTTGSGEKLNIVCTIFPQYDFCREIAGESADVNLLIDRAVDLHSYEPTASDIVEISKCDVFITVGGVSDNWVDAALNASGNENMKVIQIMDYCTLLTETEEGIIQEHEHDSHEEGHAEEYDEHVWTSLKNAQNIVAGLTDVLSELDPKNSEIFQENAERYIAQLKDLDHRYEEMIQTSQRQFLLFADRFPFLYLMNDYSLSWLAAFPGCSAETEASFQTMAQLISTVEEHNLPYVLTIDGSDKSVAEAVCRQTGAQSLELNSCQSITQKMIQEGITYIEIMESNFSVLKEALNK